MCHISVLTKTLQVEGKHIEYSPLVCDKSRNKLVDFKLLQANAVLVLVAQSTGAWTVTLHRRKCTDSLWRVTRRVNISHKIGIASDFQNYRYVRDVNSFPDCMLFTVAATRSAAKGASTLPEHHSGHPWSWMCVAADEQQSQTIADCVDRWIPHKSYGNVLQSESVTQNSRARSCHYNVGMLEPLIPCHTRYVAVAIFSIYVPDGPEAISSSRCLALCRCAVKP